MNSKVTPAGKGRTEPPNNPPRRTLVRNLIASVRSWLDKLVSFLSALLDKLPILGAFLRSRVAWILMIFVIGFAAGTAWQSYGGAARRDSTSSERIKAISLALSAARQNLDKIASELRRLESQGPDVPQRRSTR